MTVREIIAGLNLRMCENFKTLLIKTSVTAHQTGRCIFAFKEQDLLSFPD